jgi:YVTN family beta-propeller protein
MSGGSSDSSAEIRTFLIADVRGYTVFTQLRGDEAAAKLAKKFAEVAREGVEGRGGRVIELRGDEALAVFGSPRQAIRAAVEMQDRFVEETISDPALPLMVGIGLDAGEAVAVEGGYRGGALNLAARLCGQAGPGEILATQEVAHFARRVEGVRFQDRDDLVLKGLAQPVRVIRVSSEGEDAAVRLAPYAPPKVPEHAAPPRPGFPASLLRGRGLVALLVALAVVVAAISVPLLLTRGGEPALEGFGADSVGLIDVNSASLLSSVDLGARPQSIALGYGAAWVTTEASVTKIDMKTRSVVDTIPVGHGPAGVAVGFGSVWVANSGDRTLSQINPDTVTEAGTRILVGNGPTGVAVGFGFVWVVNSIDGTLVQVDPDTAEVTKTVYVGDGPTGIAVGDDALWITNSAGATVSQVSPETMTVAPPLNVGNGPAGLTVLPDGVWVANRLDGTVSEIDPETNVATARRTGPGAGGVAAAGGAIWVANEFTGTISRIDTATGETRTIAVGNAPTGLAAAGGTLWVTVRAAAPSHRGGTLRVASESSPPSIDMAVAYEATAWQIFAMTNDGLVGFRKVSGADGSLLVPDLATSLPKPTEGGTTYTFQLRPGIRYSTGDVVRPEDFRRAIERAYTTKSPDFFDDFYVGIVGSDQCTKDPPGCDLSEGIQTSKGTVTFRLKRPDPEFLYKLALHFADAVPSRTGGEEVQEPLPATGPYKFETYDPKEGFTLVRNPHFHEWSHVSQPDGYPDRIEWRFGIDQGKAMDQVIGGDLDWVYSEGQPDLARIMRQAPELVYSSPVTETWYMSLNTTRPPFDDPLVRRALNLAVNRDTVVELFGGPDQFRLTCQVLPPSYPGYQPYCPYTVDPSPGGEWTDQDFGKAQDLIRRAGVKKGTKVEVWGFPLKGFGAGLKVSLYFRDLLNDLGFHATHKAFPFPPDEYFRRLYSEKPQIGIAAWGQDYPAASNFIDLLLSCGAPFNSAGLCDPEVDRMIDRALRLQAVDLRVRTSCGPTSSAGS